jgi:hypothetical protein
MAYLLSTVRVQWQAISFFLAALLPLSGAPHSSRSKTAAAADDEGDSVQGRSRREKSD